MILAVSLSICRKTHRSGRCRIVRSQIRGISGGLRSPIFNPPFDCSSLGFSYIRSSVTWMSAFAAAIADP